MRKLAVLLVVTMAATPAFGEWYFRGGANGWGETLTTDNGDGTYSVTVSGTPNSRTEFKFTPIQGAWDNAVPAANSWAYFDAAGQLSITLDTNTSSDGWLPSVNRINVADEVLTNWQAVGDFNGWNKDDSSWLMTSIGGGLYQVQGTVAMPGNHWWKAINAGNWDSVGADNRSVNSNNAPFTTTVANETVIFQLDAREGKIRVVPEPASLALLGLGAFMLLRRR